MLDSVTLAINQRDAEQVEVLDLVRQTDHETGFPVSLRQVSDRHDLDWAEEGHEPGVIIPGTLVFRVSEISVF